MKKMILRTLLGSVVIALFSFGVANAGSFYSPSYLPAGGATITYGNAQGSFPDSDWIQVGSTSRYKSADGFSWWINGIYQNKDSHREFYIDLNISFSDVEIGIQAQQCANPPVLNGNTFFVEEYGSCKILVVHKTETSGGGVSYQDFEDDFGYTWTNISYLPYDAVYEVMTFEAGPIWW